MNKISGEGQSSFVKWRKLLIGRLLRYAGEWKKVSKDSVEIY